MVLTLDGVSDVVHGILSSLHLEGCFGCLGICLMWLFELIVCELMKEGKVGGRRGEEMIYIDMPDAIDCLIIFYPSMKSRTKVGGAACVTEY